MIIVPDKKTQGRYTLQFNLADPGQKTVSDILERQGRHKTQFITNAVLCYVNGGGKSKVDTTEALDDTALEQRIKAILSKMRPEDLPRLSDRQSGGERQAVTPEEDYSAIDETLRAFDEQ